MSKVKRFKGGETMNQIKLFNSPTGWMAWHSGPLGKEVKELFGTDTIPTCFTAQADPLMVKEAIVRLNPGVSVVVRVRDSWI